MDQAREEFNEMRTLVLEYGGKWRGYFQGMAAAYAAAYKSQEALLARVKKVTEARLKAEEARLTFALSLLTVGLAGTAASHFAKNLLSSGGITDSVIKSAKDGIVGDWLISTVKDLSKDATKAVAGKVHEKIGVAGYQVPSEPYVPSAVSPAEYGATLLQGAEERANVISDQVREWAESPQPFPPGEVPKMIRGMKDSVFFKKAPPSVMAGGTKEALLRKAKLALWIAWAQERDLVRALGKAAWVLHKRGGLGLAASSLGTHRLGLPISLIAGAMEGRDGRVVFLRMDNFIGWSKSPAAITTLFMDMRTDPEGFKAVVKHWSERFAGMFSKTS